jgi:8-oxo-dGTP diphosphatase
MRPLHGTLPGSRSLRLQAPRGDARAALLPAVAALRRTRAVAERKPVPFGGSKLALLHERTLLVYRRDDRPDIPFPDCWDLPGGGREGDETPVECVLRETREEFGIDYPADRLHWSRSYPSWRGDEPVHWFFGGMLTRDEIAAIRFGEEGQFWTMMPVEDYLMSHEAIAHHVPRVRDFLAHG